VRARFAFKANEPATFRCKLDGGAFAKCKSPFVSGVLAAGLHRFAVRATDIAGNLGPAVARTFTVKPTGPTTKAPKISQVHESAKRWRAGARLPHLSKAKPPIGTTFSFVLNETAQVKFTFKRRIPGHTKTAATLRRGGHAGINRLHFQGRISPHRKLAPGRYTVVITATAHGRRSARAFLRFVIVRG
jgi:hypothetical protein